MPTALKIFCCFLFFCAFETFQQNKSVRQFLINKKLCFFIVLFFPNKIPRRLKTATCNKTQTAQNIAHKNFGEYDGCFRDRQFVNYVEHPMKFFCLIQLILGKPPEPTYIVDSDKAAFRIFVFSEIENSSNLKCWVEVESFCATLGLQLPTPETLDDLRTVLDRMEEEDRWVSIPIGYRKTSPIDGSVHIIHTVYIL